MMAKKTTGKKTTGKKPPTGPTGGRAKVACLAPAGKKPSKKR
jgi:hypothetical protein